MHCPHAPSRFYDVLRRLRKERGRIPLWLIAKDIDPHSSFRFLQSSLELIQCTSFISAQIRSTRRLSKATIHSIMKISSVLLLLLPFAVASTERETEERSLVSLRDGDRFLWPPDMIVGNERWRWSTICSLRILLFPSIMVRVCLFWEPEKLLLVILKGC